MSEPDPTTGAEPNAAFPKNPMSSEHDRVRMLAELFGRDGDQSEVTLGIGDDAALLKPTSGTLVWSIDAQVEDVHFRREWMSLEDIGFRATMAALSDLGAMGARPLGVLSALVLPRALSDADLLAIAEGQRAASASLGTRIIGGNMTRGTTLSITTTVLGIAARPVLRRGAGNDDLVWLSGELGRAAAGLALRMAGISPRRDAEVAVDMAFRRPRALLEAGQSAASAGATALIDVSDGLTADLGRLARDSNVAVVLESDALSDPTVAEVAAALSLDPVTLVLSGGEDYALVATVPRDRPLLGFRRIGRTCSDLAPGIWIAAGNAAPTRLEERGYDHFSE